MMGDWDIFNKLLDLFTQYYTGTYGMTGIFICVMFFFSVLVKSELKYAVVFTLPLLGFFVFIGWFGAVTNAQWIVNLALIVVALFYGAAILKMLN